MAPNWPLPILCFGLSICFSEKAEVDLDAESRQLVGPAPTEDYSSAHPHQTEPHDPGDIAETVPLDKFRGGDAVPEARPSHGLWLDRPDVSWSSADALAESEGDIDINIGPEFERRARPQLPLKSGVETATQQQLNLRRSPQVNHSFGMGPPQNMSSRNSTLASGRHAASSSQSAPTRLHSNDDPPSLDNGDIEKRNMPQSWEEVDGVLRLLDGDTDAGKVDGNAKHAAGRREVVERSVEDAAKKTKEGLGKGDSISALLRPPPNRSSRNSTLQSPESSFDKSFPKQERVIPSAADLGLTHAQVSDRPSRQLVDDDPLSAEVRVLLPLKLTDSAVEILLQLTDLPRWSEEQPFFLVPENDHSILFTPMRYDADLLRSGGAVKINFHGLSSDTNYQVKLNWNLKASSFTQGWSFRTKPKTVEL